MVAICINSFVCQTGCVPARLKLTSLQVCISEFTTFSSGFIPNTCAYSKKNPRFKPPFCAMCCLMRRVTSTRGSVGTAALFPLRDWRARGVSLTIGDINGETHEKNAKGHKQEGSLLGKVKINSDMSLCSLSGSHASRPRWSSEKRCQNKPVKLHVDSLLAHDVLKTPKMASRFSIRQLQ